MTKIGHANQTILSRLFLIPFLLFAIMTINTASAAVSSKLDGIYIPVGTCPVQRCCCSNSFPTQLTTSPLTDEIIFSTQFNAHTACSGLQSMSIVAQVIDSNTALFIMPITEDRWQLKWSPDFNIIQFQQLNMDTGTIDTTCLNQLKRYTSSNELHEQSRDDITSFDMVFAPETILSTTGILSTSLPSPDDSHSIYIETAQIARSSRFDFNVYLQSNPHPSSSSLPTKTSLINAEFVTMHYISPTTLQSETATMSSRTLQMCTPVNNAGFSALIWNCQIDIPFQTGARIAFTYRIAPQSIQSVNGLFTTRQSTDGTRQIIDQNRVYETETIFIQNNSAPPSSSSFFVTDGSEIDLITMAYRQRLDGESVAPPKQPEPTTTTPTTPTTGSGNTNTPTTPPNNNNNNNNNKPPTTPTTPPTVIPEDYRALFSGDWVSTGECKSSSTCCCVRDKEVAMSVYLPDEAKAKGIKVDGINTSNKNQIVVVGYLDSHSSCFGMKSLSGTCNLDVNTKKGKCSMNGINFTASLNEATKTISIENSMFENCVSTARPMNLK